LVDSVSTLSPDIINPARVRNIKLGGGGNWEQECLEKGIIRIGFGTARGDRFVLCQSRNWEALAESLVAEGKDNKRIFDALAAKRDVIDQAFGGPLDWERLDEKRACRVRHILKQGGLSSGEEHWPRIQEAMIDAMGRLAKALKPYLPGAGV
jgi:hypothetical protein